MKRRFNKIVKQLGGTIVDYKSSVSDCMYMEYEIQVNFNGLIIYFNDSYPKGASETQKSNFLEIFKNEIKRFI